jgi:hypothetical protein
MSQHEPLDETLTMSETGTGARVPPTEQDWGNGV